MATETRGTHTPAPWRVASEEEPYARNAEHSSELAVVEHFIYDALEIYTPPRGESLEEHQANARLIAAAPELLESLTTILKGFEDGVFVRDVTRDAESSWAVRLLPFIRALQQAQSVVLKATGEVELPKVMALLRSQLIGTPGDGGRDGD